MDILIIGVSSIFFRKVLPAILSLNSVNKIHLASRRLRVDVDIPEAKRGNFYVGYESALCDVPPCIAYISLPNQLHADLTRKALLAGFHVIVDKPAFLSLDETHTLTQLARQQNLCLAESTVWSFHPQIKAVQDAFSSLGSEPKAIQGVFSFPPLSKDNFRNNPLMGGGSFHDLGRYAVSPGRVFFQDAPTRVSAEVLDVDSVTGVDTAFYISATYPRGRIFQGFFSFDAEYRNSLSILGKHVSITLEPAFTFTSKPITEINLKTDSQSKTISFDPSDTFAVFFQSVIESINFGNWDSWSNILEYDARAIHMAYESIKEKSNEH